MCELLCHFLHFCFDTWISVAKNLGVVMQKPRSIGVSTLPLAVITWWRGGTGGPSAKK
jgi:hypothetical protein